MAEFVQKNIEKRIPELEQMERIGLFEREEIRQILNRRKRFEYRLRRMKKSKEDYLQYIQYELGLYHLVQMRRLRLRITDKKTDIDLSIARKVNQLFKKAVLKFKDDIKLWLSHIEFCSRMGWENAVSTMYARLLQLHSHRPEIWVAAAKWEFEDNNSPETARHVLQRGLRFNEKSCLLWQEYFRMELMYTDKMRKRQEVLRLENTMEEVVRDAVLNAKIPFLIYTTATSVIQDVKFALSFLPLCMEFDFGVSIKDNIFEDLKKWHPECEEIWDAMARTLLTKSIAEGEVSYRPKAVKAASTVFDEAVACLPTERMWKLYLDFRLELLEHAPCRRTAEKWLSKVLSCMKTASEQSLLTLGHQLEWGKLLQNCGDIDKAIEVATAATEKWATSIDAWLLLLQLRIVQPSSVEVTLAAIDKALDSLPKENTLPIWKLGLKWISVTSLSRAFHFLENGLFYPPAVSIYIKEELLVLHHLYKGYDAAVKFYKRMLSVKPLSLGFFQKIMDIENAHIPSSADNLRSYFEDAVMEFGTEDYSLWIKYISFELSHTKGKPSNSTVLYRRAVKTLKGQLTNAFITGYTLLQLGQGDQLELSD